MMETELLNPVTNVRITNLTNGAFEPRNECKKDGFDVRTTAFTRLALLYFASST